jgi:hypothetical protein
MALKADRNELDVDISYFYNDGAVERGGIVTIDSVGSGAAMDQAGAKVKYKTGATGDIPVGVLLNDVVNLDLTRQHINWHKDEVQKGGKVSVLKKGYVVTNMFVGAAAVGDLVCLGDTTAGYVEECSLVAGTNKVIVGRYMSKADEDGYVKLEVNLPWPTDEAGTLE